MQPPLSAVDRYEEKPNEQNHSRDGLAYYFAEQDGPYARFLAVRSYHLDANRHLAHGLPAGGGQHDEVGPRNDSVEERVGSLQSASRGSPVAS